jgi:hypothetical protein
VAPRRSARELEARAAALPARPATAAVRSGEALAMLRRRGLAPSLARLDVPFPADLSPDAAERLAERLGHYGFRLFLRGAILAGPTFLPATTTRYLDADAAREHAEWLAAEGLAAPAGEGRYRLVERAQSFGGVLEWWVGRELARRLGCDVAAGVRTGARGVGGDLDVVAAAEGKLLYVELKSSPPKHLTTAEVEAFLRRVRAAAPDVAVFAVDTALRLADRVLPMLAAALPGQPPPRRLARDNWALTPHVYAVSARGDLVANLEIAIAAGRRALAPPLP